MVDQTIPGIRSGEHTPGPVTVRKCACGDRLCDQHTLSTQGAVGFALEDATLYAAAPELLAVAKRMLDYALSGAGFSYPLGSLQELENAIAKASPTPSSEVRHG